MIVGVAALLLWALHPVLVIAFAAVIYFIGLFVWERIARRIIGHKLVAFHSVVR